MYDVRDGTPEAVFFAAKRKGEAVLITNGRILTTAPPREIKKIAPGYCLCVQICFARVQRLKGDRHHLDPRWMLHPRICSSRNSQTPRKHETHSSATSFTL